MASIVTTQTKTRQGKGNRGVRKGSAQARNNASDPKPNAPANTETQAAVVAPPQEEIDDDDLCWICAEQVKYWSVSECNHRTCHVCALRLRALYKKTDCTFCKVRYLTRRTYRLLNDVAVKEPQVSVIFTVSPDATFSSFTPESIPYKDSKLAIHFETQEMMEDTLILLRFNCSNSDCDFIGSGWGDLKLHVRGTHGRLMWYVN